MFPPHRLTALLPLSGLILLAGCAGQSPWKPDQKSSAPQPQALSFPDRRAGLNAAESIGAAPTRYYIQYDVLRVEVPRGTVSRSETLWNHVDESVFPFAVTRRLRLNGFRIGLAEQGAWPAIKAILDSSAATQAAQAGLAQADLAPFAIQIDPLSRDRTIFHYGLHGKLEGSTFADSLNMLRIEHHLDPEQLSDFNLRLAPEARSAHPQTTLTATGAGLREVPVYEGKVFTDLAVEMEVPANSIIVLGPSDRAGRRALIGTEFLCDQRNGVQFERILFITPRLVAREQAGPGF